ncbi:MAG: S41 family peptidase [Gemmatimonadales bacterium]
MKRSQIAIGVTTAVLALASGGWLLQREPGPTGSVYQQARLFDDVLAHVADYYVDSLDARQLYEMAIDGMLDRLGDPYSTYLRKEDFRALSEATTGNYGGLGIQIDVRDGWITVIAPLPETPAERAGIQSGDRIVGLDGKSTEGWKNDQAVKELRGQPGTVAELSVRRVGVEQPMRFKITRALIHIRSVNVSMMLDDRVGYLALSPVNESSAREVSAAIAELMRQGMKVLVLDLRQNPGGLLDQGIAVSDLFLDPAQPIVATKGRAPNTTRTFRDSRPQTWPELPIVILVNGATASAAEIIAGALQDHDRGVVVGTPTFGKGLVQSLWQLSPESALKLTTARWYTPSGRTIQRQTKTEEQQAAQVVAAAQGGDTLNPDSSLMYKTDAGRIVFGGGGIRPDLFIAPDTFTTVERGFVRTLGGRFQEFRDVLATYALELKAGSRLPAPAFRVTDGMVDEVLRRLQGKGVTLPDSVLAGGRGVIAQEIGYEAARYVFGRPAEFRRRMGDDRQVQQALALARKARSPKELLSLATAQAAAAPARR